MPSIIPSKSHLSNLPDIDVSQVPSRPDSISKRGLVLLPIFSGFPNNFPLRDDVAHHVASCACWARRSWLVNTDANDYGIEVKFYVEERVKDSAIPILERNFVEERDIIWFDGSRLEGVLSGVGTHGIKKCASYNDDRFQDYDWIFDVDSDVFAVSATGEKYPFFQNFFSNCHENIVGACFVSSLSSNPECLTPYDIGWGTFEGDSVEAWKSRFEAIAGQAMLNKYFDPNLSFMTCNGSIVAFPAKHFMHNRRADCDFLVNTTRELLDLEATLSLWHSMGNPVFSITDHVKLAMFHAHFGPQDVDLFLRYFSEGPFLFHYAFPGINYFWRKGMGII